MPAKTKSHRQPARSRVSAPKQPPVTPEVVKPVMSEVPPPETTTPPVSSDPSLFPPLPESSPMPDTALRLSPEIVESAPTPVSSSVSQLASVPTEPQPVSAPDSTSPTINPPHRKLLWIIVIIALIVGIAVVILAVVNLALPPTPPKYNAPTSVPTSVPSPTIPPPTPSPILDRGILKIKILNGSGIPGLAGKAKSTLEKLGYTDIATANADTYDFTSTQLAFKSESLIYQSLLSADLQTSYTLSDQVASLSADNTYDVIITLGQK